MRKGLIALFVATALVAPALSWAHEGHKGAHKMMGTVTAVHAEMNHIEMKTKDGKTVGFYVNEKTKYHKGKTTASLADIKVGSRVVVSATTEGDKMAGTEKMTATEVHLSADADKSASPKPHSSPHP